MMASKYLPYEALERRARRDLAARTIADPEAPAVHVEAAMRVLETVSERGLDLPTGALSLDKILLLRQVLRSTVPLRLVPVDGAEEP